MNEAQAEAKKKADIITRRRFLQLPDGWTSLDAAKLGVELLKGLAFPAALAYVGIEVSRIKQVEEALVKRRLQSLDAIAPAANDILCFVTVVGDWRHLNPEKIIDQKRQIDREMRTYLGVWSQNVWQRYQAFMALTFEEYGGGSARAAPIYGDVTFLQREMGDHFDPSWIKEFKSPPPGWSQAAVRQSYEAWMRALREDIGSASR